MRYLVLASFTLVVALVLFMSFFIGISHAPWKPGIVSQTLGSQSKPETSKAPRGAEDVAQDESQERRNFGFDLRLP